MKPRWRSGDRSASSIRPLPRAISPIWRRSGICIVTRKPRRSAAACWRWSLISPSNGSWQPTRWSGKATGALRRRAALGGDSRTRPAGGERPDRAAAGGGVKSAESRTNQEVQVRFCERLEVKTASAYSPLHSDAPRILYLIAIIDWATRRVFSNGLKAGFCVEALSEAVARFGKPKISNSDPGSQFTSEDFTRVPLDHRIEISMESLALRSARPRFDLGRRSLDWAVFEKWKGKFG